MIRRRLAFVALALVVAASVLLANPVSSWRTGETTMPALDLRSGDAFARLPLRVWIDTDAACGAGARHDPDDCFALLALLSDPRIEVAGISTVFGNAPQAATHEVARSLVERIASRRPVAVHAGSAQAVHEEQAAAERPAHAAIQSALAQGPLTFIALGPLTNLAAALASAPELRRQLAGIVAVMGRRPGHLFHPSEGTSTGAMPFGHGPVFRDLNVAMDPLAARRPAGWPTARANGSRSGGARSAATASIRSTSWPRRSSWIRRSSAVRRSPRGWGAIRCSACCSARLRFWSRTRCDPHRTGRRRPRPSTVRR